MTCLRKALLFGAMAILALLLVACVFYKPLRVGTPETFGLTCVTDTLCVEDMSTVAEATELRDDALRFVAENVGLIDDPHAFSSAAQKTALHSLVIQLWPRFTSGVSIRCLSTIRAGRITACATS